MTSDQRRKSGRPLMKHPLRKKSRHTNRPGPSQSTRRGAMGPSFPSLEPVDSGTPYSAPLSRCPLRRHSSAARGVCVNALVRICAGDNQHWSSLPRQQSTWTDSPVGEVPSIGAAEGWLAITALPSNDPGAPLHQPRSAPPKTPQIRSPKITSVTNLLPKVLVIIYLTYPKIRRIVES